MGLLSDKQNCGLHMRVTWRGGGKTFPAHAQPEILRIWKEVHSQVKFHSNTATKKPYIM